MSGSESTMQHSFLHGIMSSGIAFLLRTVIPNRVSGFALQAPTLLSACGLHNREQLAKSDHMVTTRIKRTGCLFGILSQHRYTQRSLVRRRNERSGGIAATTIPKGADATDAKTCTSRVTVNPLSHEVLIDNSLVQRNLVYI